ncbi:hypothetical protein DW322_16975 [Rhodococcus rhodnii]|uniref:Uncharacterized protein n=1 Tax=Rhodococcus rhodnii TaxID=38312 RepID=A0A6P2CFN9_9NOCA|nr:hypothetical protein DW322_16975 [Rhodococcus rhodnii]
MLRSVEYRDDVPPTVVVFNETSHLPMELRWTGFSAGAETVSNRATATASFRRTRADTVAAVELIEVDRI